MVSRKSLAIVAASAAVAFGGVASADVVSRTAASELSLSQPLPQPKMLQTAEPRRPLMGLLDKAGLAAPLDDAGISIYGHVEGSWSYYADPGESKNQVARGFDFENQDPTLNQISISVERAVTVSSDAWDVGGKMEWIWGGDSRFIHSTGLFDYYGLSEGPDEQFDLTQLYVDVAIPVGNGLRVRAGKFVTLIGYETIDPTTRPLYTTGYLFNFAIPFAHTGVLGTYAFNDQWIVDLGIVRGWDDSLEDKNGAPAFLGRVTYNFADERTALYTTVSVGPEQADDTGDYRTLIDLVLTHQLNDNISVALQGDYAWESAASSVDDDHGEWYGLGAWMSWTLTDMFTANGRLEYFNDSYGSRGLDTVLYSATAGLTVTLFPADELLSNLKIRPELRYDYADNGIFSPDSTGSADQNNQLSVHLEAFFTF